MAAISETLRDAAERLKNVGELTPHNARAAFKAARDRGVVPPVSLQAVWNGTDERIERMEDLCRAIGA